MNQFLYFSRRNRIECGSWFVHQQYRRRYRHCTGNAKTLLLSTGQSIGRFLQLIFDLIPKRSPFQCLLYPLTNESIIFHPIDTEPISYILEYTFRERIRTLKNHSHILSKFIHFHSFGINIMSVNPDLPFQASSRNQVVHPVEKTEESRFTTSRRSDKGNYRLFFNLHADPLQGMKVTIPEVYIACIYFYCIHILINSFLLFSQNIFSMHLPAD